MVEHRWLLGALIGIVGIALAAGAPAGAEELPPAEELLERYSAASGGREAFAKVHTRVTRGTMEITGAGIAGELVTWEARPDRFLMEFEAEGLGSVRSGSNGEVVWELSDIQGARVLEGAERAFAVRTSQLDATLRWRDLYTSYETTGTDTVAGTSCFQVKMTPREGNEETWCLSEASGLPVSMETVVPTAMGEIPVQIELGDYRDVDGITVPFRTSQRLMMQEMVTQLESVEHNVELADDRFALPAAVQALLDEGAAEEPSEGSATDATAAPSTLEEPVAAAGGISPRQ